MSGLAMSVTRPAASSHDAPRAAMLWGQNKRVGGRLETRAGKCRPADTIRSLTRRDSCDRGGGRGQLAQLALPRYPYDRLARRRSNAYASPAQRAEA